MGTAEATRGPIEEVTRIRYGMSPQVARDERLQVIGKVMGELGPVLVEPVYEGDIETALLHNMGRAAFGFQGTGDDEVRAYIKFSADIDAGAEEGPTPVLFVSQIRPGAGRGGNTETALVMVDPEQTTFRSSMVHERDVQTSGYGGKIAVTRRSLSLVGDTSTIHADITGYGHDYLKIDRYAEKKTGQGELVLSERSVIDGKNGHKPISVEHDGYTQDTARMWAGSTYLVGWENIGNALAARIYHNAHGNHDKWQKPQGVLPHVLNLRSFLEGTGQLEVLLDHHESLKKVFERAVSLEESVAAL